MSEDQRPFELSLLIADYVKSPSLRHLRDPYFIEKLAKEILRTIDRRPPPWKKWETLREEQLKAAATTWIPIEDLRQHLNQLPGETLTLTDVTQRMRDIQENGFELYPDDELQEACLARYQDELESGTEMTAVIYALQEFVDNERARIRDELIEKLERIRTEEKEAAKQRLFSGADCNWTSLEGASELYCRTNGRLFKLVQNQDKRWRLSRIQKLTDDNEIILGTYSRRGDATKAVKQIAYQPEPRY